MTLKIIGGQIHDPLFSGPNKAERKKAHRERKHAMINEKLAELRGRYGSGLSAAQRASEARMHADRVLAEERREKEKEQKRG